MASRQRPGSTSQPHDQKEDGMSAPTNTTEAQQIPDEVEVEFRPGQEDTAEFDQKPHEERVEEDAKSAQDVLDTIVPRKDPKVWEIGPEGMRRTYVQKELSFLGKMQWFSLVGEALDKALSGPNGMSLNSLMAMPGAARGVFRMEDFKDADLFVQAISKLLSAMPDFLTRSYMIWLNVPDYDYEIVEGLMKLPPDEGGISDEQGVQIIETFLDQNYGALADFFSSRLGKLGQRISKLNEDRASRR